ncbi:MAG: hypothetical protein A2X56_08665 [Nitrospirae bacterium GWC2_57_13]|nr:MAG: hypothetical protein A2X56_08665 [Nitrospirae bacterium GWC2_57_13]
MDQSALIGYPLLLIALLEAVLGLILLRHNPRRSPVNRSIAVFSFTCAGFSFFAGLMYLPDVLGISMTTASRASWIGWMGIPAGLQFVYYTKDEQSRTARLIGYILYPFWTFILLVCLFTDLVRYHVSSAVPFSMVPGPLEAPLRLVGAVMILWLLYAVYRAREGVGGRKRRQLDYFYFGTLIFGGGAALVSGFLQLNDAVMINPSLGAYFSFPWVAITFYAIMRHQLFDLRGILSRSLAIGLIAVLFSFLHIVLFTIMEPRLGPNPAIAISIVLLGFIFWGTPVSKIVQRRVHALVLQGRYDYQEVLKGSITAIVSILEIDELLAYLSNVIRTSLGTTTICFFLPDKEGRFVLRHGMPSHATAEACININALPVENAGRSSRIMRMEHIEKCCLGDAFRGLKVPLAELDVELVAPLMHKKQLQGILLLGAKRNDDPYVSSDIDLLEALAAHAAIALENASLYREAGKAQESLRQSEANFRSLTESTAAGIFIHQGDRFLYANPAAERIAGYTLEEYLHMDFCGIVHPDYLPLVRERGLARLRGDDQPQQYEFKVVTKDGRERWANISVTTIEYEGKRAVIGTIFDVTDLKIADEEKARFYQESVRQYQQRIEEEQRYAEEKESILRDLHDGVGGLTTNVGLLAELAMKKEDLSEIRQALATISSLAQEGVSEIRSFMGSLESKDMTWDSLAADLRSKGMNTLGPHNIQFSMSTSISETVAFPGSLFCLNFFRIYKEALTNVVKHSKAASVDVKLTVEEGKLELLIQDDGRGEQEKAGTGRGIANMKIRAREAGGSLIIDRTKGTVVSLEIPIPRKYPDKGMAEGH